MTTSRLGHDLVMTHLCIYIDQMNLHISKNYCCVIVLWTFTSENTKHKVTCDASYGACFHIASGRGGPLLLADALCVRPRLRDSLLSYGQISISLSPFPLRGNLATERYWFDRMIIESLCVVSGEGFGELKNNFQSSCFLNNVTVLTGLGITVEP